MPYGAAFASGMSGFECEAGYLPVARDDRSVFSLFSTAPVGPFGGRGRDAPVPFLIERFENASFVGGRLLADPATGAVELVREFKAPLSESKLFALFPSVWHYCDAAVRCGEAMVRRGYLRPPELPAYAGHMRLLARAYRHMSAAAPGQHDLALQAFLLFERTLRLEQWASGVAWETAFDHMLFSAAMCRLGARVASAAAGAGKAPAAAAAPVGAVPAKPRPPGVCWAWLEHGRCKYGADCQYAATHTARGAPGAAAPQ
jgi:hypothetical protein